MRIFGKIVRTISIVSLLTLNVSAQISQLRSVVISGGMARPYGDEQFYDYWNNGLGMRVEYHDGSGRIISALVAIDFLRFGLDDERLFRVLQLSADPPDLSGGWKTMSSIEGLLRYHFTSYTNFDLFLFAGIGLQHLYRSETVIAYPFAPALVASVSNVYVIAPFGVSLQVPILYGINMQCDLYHVNPLTGDVQHEYSGVRMGVVLPIKRSGDEE